MHLIVKCQFIIPGIDHVVVGVGDSFFGQIIEIVSFDWFLFVRSNSQFFWLIPLEGLHQFFTESLILAQDERWRRA